MRPPLRLPRRLFHRPATRTAATPAADARRSRHLLPLVERCESRTLLATAYTVDLLTDANSTTGGQTDGTTTGDLRYCLTQVDATGGTISFAPNVTGTISLSRPLPAITLASGNPAGTTIAINGPGASTLTIQGNSTNAGSIFIVNSGTTASLSGLTLTGGSATYGGGIENEGTLTLSGLTIRGNSASSFGGGIFNQGALTLSNSTLSGNSSSLGGAIANYGKTATLTLIGSTLTKNSATSFDGGGIGNFGTMTLSNSTLSGNSAYRYGGGIDNYGTLTLSNSTLSNNSADAGGGILNKGTLTLNNSTLSGNSAKADGGGLFNYSREPVVLVNCTLTGNSAPTGGGIKVFAGYPMLVNTIAAANTTTPNGTTASDISGSVDPGSTNNLIGTGGSGGLVSGTNGNQTDVPVANLGLGTLSNNGGPTPTIALLAGSLALDAGTTTATDYRGNPISIPTTDERGAQRGPVGLDAGTAPDIGAYEASSSFLVTSTADDGSLGTLRAGVLWANGSTNAQVPAGTTVANTITFDTTGAFATAQTIASSVGLGSLGLATSGGVPISIVGPTGAGGPLVTLQGGGLPNNFSLVRVAAGTTASLSGLILRNGNATYGGGIFNQGTLTLSGSTLSGDSASAGGGIFNYLGATLTISDSRLTGDIGTFGAGIANSGSLTISGSTFSGNRAAIGGGINSNGTLTISDSTFIGNSATTGGAIAATGGTVSLTGSRLTGNSAINGQALDNSGATVTANDNWWGADALPGAPGTDSVATTGTGTTTLASHLSLLFRPELDKIGTDSQTALDASVVSSADQTTVIAGTALDGLTLAIAPGTLGTVDTSALVLVGGEAQTVFRSGTTLGQTQPTATLDNAVETTTITVVGTPTATPQTVTTLVGTDARFAVGGTDPDSPPLPLFVSEHTSPSHGTVQFANYMTRELIYRPNPGFHGTDSFTFRVSNGTVVSSFATVTINVAIGTPTATAQTVAVAHDSAGTTLPLAGTDPDRPALPLFYSIVTGPAHGSFSNLNPTTGTLTYTPDAGYHGTDTIVFVVTNGTNTSAPATETLSVGAATPTARPQAITTDEGTPVAITLTGTDGNDDPALPLVYTITTAPTHGTLTGTGANLTYTPNAGSSGSDSFAYTVSNGTTTSDPATVSLTVLPAITGKVFQDLSGTGVLTATNPGLAGRTVYLDLNGDGQLDSGETTTTTDSAGVYAFTGVTAPSPTVRLAPTLDPIDRDVAVQTTTGTDGSTNLGVTILAPTAPLLVSPGLLPAAPSPDATTAYVTALYRSVLGRNGSTAEVAAILALISQDGLSRGKIAALFVDSVEHRTAEVASFYEAFLSRAPDATARFWVDALLNGATEAQVAQGILDSTEYQAAHPTAAALATGLYHDVLAREADATFESTFSAAATATPDSLVSLFVASAEAHDQAVASFYEVFLHRQRAGDTTSAFWTNQLDAGHATLTDVVINILASDEFLQNALAGRS